jgi:hypothetical protein
MMITISTRIYIHVYIAVAQHVTTLDTILHSLSAYKLGHRQESIAFLYLNAFAY